MWIRESQFIEKDAKDPRHSSFDMDFHYTDDYRLSLRFNFESGRYEVYKYSPSKLEPLEVCYTYVDLGLAVRCGNRFTNEYRKTSDQKDEVIYDLSRGEVVPAEEIFHE